jgi:hypothetical protein
LTLSIEVFIVKLILNDTKYKQFFNVDINEYLDLLKGLGAQAVIWTFYNQVVKVESRVAK